MDQNQKIEEVLNAWLYLSMSVSNNRLVSDMPLNEAVICHLLYRNQLHCPDAPLTATDLCRATKMLKSQMNRTLQSMEDKGLIFRERSSLDKRQVYVFINHTSPLYQNMHEKALMLVEQFMSKIGLNKADDIIRLFTIIGDTADEITGHSS
ncbi:MarR family transcriptional regulator [Parablautia sp. Marseille-Q6255]|uniref:MarR family transcriptional regulator n=1 Tax=Parablautia sp. Marseille-Q6255 TaxID=3039593 RepID=UPI0024BC0576|nr:MarR family transcriptional regulator [Parablautia sp. Marseille-Q6255]